jgi:hypothetical protein
MHKSRFANGGVAKGARRSDDSPRQIGTPFRSLVHPHGGSMHRFSTWLVALVSCLLAACNTLAPISNVDNVAVSTQSNRPLNPQEVRGAILRAGAGLGWVMKDDGPNRMTGTLVLRTHTAEVEIPYSAASYAIRYKSSTNLMAADGKIHRNYNGWVLNLTRGINAQLAAS